MNNSDYDPETRENFYDRFTGYTDRKIKEILKNHKDYQEGAVSAAIKIAIERELIHSDQDLMAPEYQTTFSSKMSAFPEISDTYQYRKIVKSIFRMLFLVSLIPIIFGILKYTEGLFQMSYMSIGTGLLWLLLTFALLKTRRLIFIMLQFLLLLSLSISLGSRLVKQEILPVTDMMVLVIFITLIIYLLLYLRKLILTEPQQLSEQ